VAQAEQVTARSPRHDAPGGSRALGRNPDFLKFWAGEAVSLVGTQVTLLALPLTAVLTLHAGPAQIGTLRFLQLVPFLVFALLFGVLVDRVRRRPLMIVANASRAVLIGLVPALALMDALHMIVLYAVAFGIGVGAVLFDVCWMSYVPTLVRNRQNLMAANARLGSTASGAEVAGPGIAGAVVAAVTAPVALAIDAVSYLASVVSLLLIRTPEARPTTAGDGRRHLLAEIGEGLRYVFGNPYLRVLALLGASYNFFLTFIETLFLVYAVRDLTFDPGLIGLVLSAGAVGGLLGAALSNLLTRCFGLGRVYTAAAVVGFVSPALIPAAAGSRPLVLAMLVSAFFLTSFGIGIANVIVISLRQAVTPGHLLGRMNAGMRTLMFGLAALGAPAGGFLGVGLGLRPSLWIACVGSALAVIPVFFSLIPRLRVLPEPRSP
jgi:MFS family permease